jgi:antitoxin (DNA-binding transcriptional repressor) of toxin-antitoxin stability system
MTAPGAGGGAGRTGLADVVTRDYIDFMLAVGVRDLKANLSRYLRDVERGEVVLVTDRGRVVAELRAATGAVSQESEVDRALRRLATRVPLAVGEPHDPSAYEASPLHVADGTARRLLDAERGET